MCTAQPRPNWSPSTPPRVDGLRQQVERSRVILEVVLGIAEIPEGFRDATPVVELPEDHEGFLGHGPASRDVDLGDHVDEADVVELLRDDRAVTRLAREGECLVVEPLRCPDLAAPVGQPGRGVESDPAKGGIRGCGRQCQQCHRSLIALGEVAAELPHPPHRPGDAEADVGGATLHDPAQGGPDVVELALQPVQPPLLIWPGVLRSGLLRQLEECQRVASPDLVDLAGFGQPFHGEVADCLEHPEPRVADSSRPGEGGSGRRGRRGRRGRLVPISSAGPQTASASSRLMPPENVEARARSRCAPGSRRS